MRFGSRQLAVAAGGCLLAALILFIPDSTPTVRAQAPGAPREGECATNPFPDNNPGPGSLKRVPVPEAPNLNEFIRDRRYAILLGKALFWDMQVGSDGIQACGSCHFRAGADPRSKNQLAPSGRAGTDNTIQLGGPNFQLLASNFPLHKLSDATDRRSTILQSVNDVVSSQGVKRLRFDGAPAGESQDQGTVLPDSTFHVRGLNTRRVEPRNTPTVINAVYNRRNLWDGRADPIFNGVNEFGVRDPNAKIVNASNLLNPVFQSIRIEPASLASQAVGPPVSEIEMGFEGRPFAAIGRRLIDATPLAKQEVAWDDSVLGTFSYSLPGNPRKGLRLKYEQLIQLAFHSRYWLSNKIVDVTSSGPVFRDRPNRPLRANEYTVMEYNFSLFFGLALQMYQATLVSDDAPIDRYFDGQTNALTQQQIQGLALFDSDFLACAACHAGAEFTNASTRIILGANGEPGEVIERMLNGQCEVVIYDQSFYNIGVRPTAEDLGIGANDPYGNPLSIARLLTMPASAVPTQALLGINYPNIANPPPQLNERTSAMGAFKVPSLRNVELTAPYFHNGGQRTLREAIEFYNRGGDFRDQNVQFIDFEIGKLSLTNTEIDALVAFLRSLTDPRVVNQQAPFDHPQILVPNGHVGNQTQVTADSQGTALDQLLNVPAVGRNGGPLPKGFLEP